MKRIIAVLCSLLLVFSVAACSQSKDPETAPVSTPTPTPVPAPTPTPKPTPSVIELSGDSYWAAQDGITDLTLWSDGAARIRDIAPGGFIQNEDDLSLMWKQEEDGTVILHRGDEPCAEAILDKDSLQLIRPDGTVLLRQESMPEGAGLLYSPAELRGTWELSGGITEGYEWDARSEDLMGSLVFYPSADGSMLMADYESHSIYGYFSESSLGNELTAFDEALYYDCGNQEWYVRMGPEIPTDSNGCPAGTEYCLTLLDGNTILFQSFYTLDSFPAVSYQYFTRVLPETGA